MIERTVVSENSLAVADLVDCATRHAVDVDQRCRLHPESVHALVSAGFARYFVPGRWGGTAGAFLPLISAAIAVGETCAATAWCATLFAAHGRIAAYLPESAQREIWDPGPDTVIAASLMPPAGCAAAVRGGWLLRGRWDRASGVDVADWVLVSSRAPDHDENTIRIFAVPAEDYVVQNTWRTMGMRGTGSNTVVLDDVVVPERRTVALADLLRTQRRGRARCHNVPFSLVAGPMFAAPVAGAAQGATAEHAFDHAGGFDSETAQAVARSAGEARAAALLLREAARRADEDATDARAIGENQRDAAVAAELCVTAVDRLFRSRGSRALNDDDPVQRRWRDIRAAASHGTLRLAAAADACARAALT